MNFFEEQAKLMNICDELSDIYHDARIKVYYAKELFEQSKSSVDKIALDEAIIAFNIAKINYDKSVDELNESTE